jgi:hypothetical protein
MNFRDIHGLSSPLIPLQRGKLNTLKNFTYQVWMNTLLSINFSFISEQPKASPFGGGQGGRKTWKNKKQNEN